MIAFSLLLSSFLAATILPFSSEAALIAAIHYGLNPIKAIVVASIGNISAIGVNYFLGYFLYTKTRKKLLSSAKGIKVYFCMKRYKKISLWLSFLPVIGDPLTLVAGIVKIPFWYFIIVAGLLRIGRYVFLVYLFL